MKREYKWHAIYTKSRAEKKLFAELTEKGIEAYLPLQKKLRVWSDRKKWVETPLFSSYVFVKVSEKEYYTAINSTNSVCYVTARGKAVVVPEKQIEALRLFLADEKRKVEVTNDELTKGQRVEVLIGPLAGTEGEIVEVRGKNKLVLRFDSIGAAVLAEIETDEVKFAAE